MAKRTWLFGLVLGLVGLSAPALPAAAATPVSVMQGATYRTAVFPNDMLAVPDPTQLTGKRVNFRVGVDYPACTAADYSICDGFAMLNKLDGFDLNPRVTIPFTGPIDITSVNDTDVFIQGPGGRTQLLQLVWDPASNTLGGIANAFLQENSLYRVVVTSGVKDKKGNPINACGSICVTPFTTRTATAVLDHIRKALDDGSAYAKAGIPTADSRKLTFTQGGKDDVFVAAEVLPSIANPTNGIVREDQVSANPADPLAAPVTVPVLIPPLAAGTYAFGSYMSPRYQYVSKSGHVDSVSGMTDGVIPALATTQTPQPLGADRLGVILVLPKGSPPAGGWPVAVYGPGFTRSKYDIFVTADYNAALGVATIATDPAGHGFGPRSRTTVTTVLGSTSFKSWGRGRDLDGDGCIYSGLNDGVGPSAHVTSSTGSCPTKVITGATPSHKTLDGVQSGLIQTVIDNMSLVRTIEAGNVNVPTIGPDVLSKTAVSYYGLSFGGIYGTMLMGIDPHLTLGLLNVPGGPIIDIARLSVFRVNLQSTLAYTHPSGLNGGPGLNGFTESLPLRGDPPETNPYPGSIFLQETFASANWYDRSGSPESFTPLMRLRPPVGAPPKTLLFETAFGDQTVPNPTAGNIYRAGQLYDLVEYYRNDKTPTYASDPHGWLADPTLAGRTLGEAELGAYLATGGTVVNPNPVLLEYPIVNRGNLDCLHYPEPQTGVSPNPQPYPQSIECPALAADLNGGWLDPIAFPGSGITPTPGPTTGGSQPGAGGHGSPNTAAARLPWIPGTLVAAGLALMLVGLRRRRRPGPRSPRV